MAVFGNPQDILSTPYGYSGQFSPETAVAEQALNRKRLITNLLMQQGLQGAPAGQMVGRFYVPSSPLQGASHLIQAGLGAYLGSKLDDQQKELAQADNDAKNKVIQAYLDARKPKQVMDQVPQPPPAPPAPPAMTPDQAQPEASLPTEPFRGIAPRPEGPYSGEVGAVPMPDMGIQSDKPPLPAQPFSSIAGQENMQGLDMGNVQPADMSQFANPSGPAPQAPSMPPSAAPPAQAAPMPAPQPMMRTIEQSPEDRYAQIVQLMTNSHPAVQRLGAMEFQRMQQENEHNAQRQALQQEREAQREFLANENASNRDVRREGIAAQAQTAMATLQGNMIMRDMALQQSDVNSARHAELLKQQNADRMELQKWQSKLQADTARQHDQTLKSIAEINMQGRKDLAGMKDTSKQESKEQSKESAMGTIAQLRDSYNRLRDMGSITDTTKSGRENALAAAGSSSLGQALGRTFGTQAQSQRNTIEQLRNPLITQIMRATGASAKSLDSNMELQAWLKSATDPTLDYQTNMRALDNLERIINSGHLPGEGGSQAPAAVTPSSGGATLNALPQGAKQIGTSGGKPVYQTPDGKKFIGE